MKFFKRREAQKESKVVKTPETVEVSSPKLKKFRILFLLWNILSIALYSCYTFFITYRLSQKNFLSKVILYMLIAYAAIFLLLIIFSVKSKKKMKNRLKNYKSAVKFLKYAIQIINFVISIITVINSFIATGTTSVSSVLYAIYAIFSLFVTLFFIFFEIVKIIIRKNIPLIKYNLLEMREKDSTPKIPKNTDDD